MNKLFRVGWTGKTTVQRAAVWESLSPVKCTFHAAQGKICFLGRMHTLLAHIKFFIHWYP